MAWIVKDSANATYETRSEPYLTDEMKQRFKDDIIPRYEQTIGALLPILNEIQHTYHCVPFQAMQEIANLLELAPATVYDTVSFYEELHIEPVGEYVIGVCQSIACEVCGHQAILDHIRQKLDVEPHETTDDGKFTLMTLECLGACEGAPCCLVNDKRYDNLTIQQIDEIIDSL